VRERQGPLTTGTPWAPVPPRTRTRLLDGDIV
jgi:hypothetical protein